MQRSDELSAALEQARLRGAIASSIPPIHRLRYPRLTQTEVKEQANQPDDHRSAPDHQGPSINLIKVHLLSSERLSKPNPAPRHTTNPPIPCLGDSRSAGRPAADFGTASPCGWPLVWTPAVDAILVFAGQPMQRKCTTIRITTSSGCSRQRTLPVPAAFRVELSTEPLREASCGRHGFAIGSVFNPQSWSDGSVSGSLHRNLDGRRGPADPPASPRAVA